MINRRRALQSYVSFAAASVSGGGGILFGSLLTPGAGTADESRRSLAEILRDAIDLCRTNTKVPRESRRLCEIALIHVQRSDDVSPAFWQACADSVARLEVAVSASEHADLKEQNTTAEALYQLRSLRECLLNQTVQVIGGLGQSK